MTDFTSAIYVGRVVHKRLTPRRHAFSYRVFSLALDVDEIDHIAGTLRLFGRNRRGLVSFHDSDHGRGDGVRVAEHIRSTLTEVGLGSAGARVVLLCYPRLLGFVFNPLSVYFCHDRTGQLGAIVYEVSNTFRERTSYVIPVGRTRDGAVHQVCAKQMYVSPFTPREARYSFHVAPPGDDVVIGIALRDDSGPILKTHFRGERRPLTDRTLATTVASHPLMTAKIVGAIHLEAARLWMKGVPLVERHTSAGYCVAIVRPLIPGAADAR